MNVLYLIISISFAVVLLNKLGAALPGTTCAYSTTIHCSYSKKQDVVLIHTQDCVLIHKQDTVLIIPNQYTHLIQKCDTVLIQKTRHCSNSKQDIVLMQHHDIASTQTQ